MNDNTVWVHKKKKRKTTKDFLFCLVGKKICPLFFFCDFHYSYMRLFINVHQQPLCIYVCLCVYFKHSSVYTFYPINYCCDCFVVCVDVINALKLHPLVEYEYQCIKEEEEEGKKRY